MKKNITILLFLCISSIIVNAQSINNKNCNIQSYNLIKSDFEGFTVYKQIKESNDTLVSKNFIADSENYFDLMAIKINKRKYRIIVIEYSPKVKTSCKATTYIYNNKTTNISIERLSYSMKWECIGIPENYDWDKELKYSKLINEAVTVKLFKELLANN
ncbi:hypothetical protein AMR72_04400 [Flavobacterium psychrophilum]|nr:hypothetical protein AMR72_04400 [Flavobacterium psychrophilum]AOE51822.1 hypothetical protein ALW18_04395 [Flavobacterium psychrophilum]